MDALVARLKAAGVTSYDDGKLKLTLRPNEITPLRDRKGPEDELQTKDHDFGQL